MAWMQGLSIDWPGVAQAEILVMFFPNNLGSFARQQFGTFKHDMFKKKIQFSPLAYLSNLLDRLSCAFG